MRERSALVGSLVAGFLASLCCLGPLLLGAFGLGSLGLAAAFAPYRPWLLGLTAVLVGLGFYFAYRPLSEAQCAPDGSCPAPVHRGRHRAALWAFSLFTLALAMFPQWSRALHLPVAARASNSRLASGDTFSSVVRLDVQGMTCAACEEHVEQELQRVAGVRTATVSYDLHEALVQVSRPIELSNLTEAVDRAGYRASIEGTTTR